MTDGGNSSTSTQRHEASIGLRIPGILSFEGNIAENWRRWKTKFGNYMLASGADKKAENVKIAILTNIIGDEAEEKFETFTISDENKQKYEEVIKSFENYCVPKRKNESINRHIFMLRNQEEGESYDQFVTSLKKLSSSCNFGQLRDSLIKDRIIGGIRNVNLKDRLLREDDLTLEKCETLCKAAEAAEMQLKALKKATTKEINEVGFQRNFKKFENKSYQHRNHREESKSTSNKVPQHQTCIIATDVAINMHLAVVQHMGSNVEYVVR